MNFWVKLFKPNRSPDFVVGTDGPYMNRWYLIRKNRWFNVYLHEIVHSDDDRALHDHPWRSLSVILQGGYAEVTPQPSGGTTTRFYWRGHVIYRKPTHTHRIEVFSGRVTVWTLFITGRKVREWGFHCPDGWRPWQSFADRVDTGKVGRGCN